MGLSLEQQEFFAQQIIEEQWSVRQLEQALKSYKNKAMESPQNAKKDQGC